jgi:RNA exonuclease 1
LKNRQPFVLTCDRCTTLLPSSSFCKHHPGKKSKTGNDRSSIIYNCCGAPLKSEPCSTARIHVYNPAKLPPQMLLERWSFFTLAPADPSRGNDSFGVFAMDFEMVYLEDGTSTLARVSVVDYWDDQKIVADFLVKPSVPIFDYNTRFSGITEESFIKEPYKSMDETKEWFCNNFTQHDIFIGHSLENDLIALRLIHKRVIDTSILFFDAPAGKKISLERLTAKHVKAFIQDGNSTANSGHDSVEDARACIHLVRAFLQAN